MGSFFAHNRNWRLSGIGECCRLYGRVVIGDYVIMGRECFIYTYNHETSRIDIPMQEQGCFNQFFSLIFLKSVFLNKNKRTGKGAGIE